MTDPTPRAIADVLTAIEDVALVAPALPARGRATPRMPLWRPVTIAAASFAAVLLVVGLGTFGLVGDGQTETPDAASATTMLPIEEATVTTVSPPEQTTVTTEAVSDVGVATIAYENVSAVRQDPTSGDLVSIREWIIYRSSDSGASWTSFHGETGGTIEAFDVSASGQIVAIENRNDMQRDEHGPDSVFNYTPRVHLYDPETDQWTVAELPRPALPVPDLGPAPMDGSGTCELGGLQSWVDGVTVAYGEQIAIVGSHFVVGESVCRGFPFLWTSTNGTDWTIVPDTGTDTALSGLVWDGDSYIAYGSPQTTSWIVEDPAESLVILESADLSTWTPITIDLSVLPEHSRLNAAPSTSGNTGEHMSGPIPAGTGELAFVFPVVSMPASPDKSIPDVAALSQWLSDTGYVNGFPLSVPDVQQTLDMLDVEFPLDDEDVKRISSFYLVESENLGRLTVEKSADGAWTTAFVEN